MLLIFLNYLFIFFFGGGGKIVLSSIEIGAVAYKLTITKVKLSFIGIQIVLLPLQSS